MEVGNILGVIIVDIHLCFEFVNYFRWKKPVNLYCFMEVETVLGYSMGRDYYRFSPQSLLMIDGENGTFYIVLRG